MHILFVCTGNISRSPMAEILAPHIFNEPSLEFSSAGTHGLHDYAISREAERLLQRNHISQMTVDAFRSRRLTAATSPRRWPEFLQAGARPVTHTSQRTTASAATFVHDESPLQKKRGLDRLESLVTYVVRHMARIRAITCHACVNGGASCLSAVFLAVFILCSTNRSNSCRIHGCASRRQG